MENQIDTNSNEIDLLFDLWAKYKHLWIWFVLSGFVCCSIAVVYIKITPKTYKRTASVLIKDRGSMQDISAIFGGGTFNLSSYVQNEVEAFRSPQLVQDAIRRSDLMIGYNYQKKLKPVDLYGRSPIKASFPDAKESDSFSFHVEFTHDQSVILSFDMPEMDSPRIRGKFNDTLQTPIGKVVISPTSHHSDEWCFVPINVYKHNIFAATGIMGGGLSSYLARKDNDIVTLEFIDVNINRADDFLNALMNAYNDNWIFEKNREAVATLELFKEKLPVVEHELRTIGDKLERFKSQNLLTNVQSAASLYMSQSSDYTSRIVDVSNQINMATLTKDFLKKNTSSHTILPSTGLSNAAIERQIGEYNTAIIKRDELIANSSDKNPVIGDMNNTLATMRSSIEQAVDNQIQVLEVQLSGYQTREAQITRSIASNPGQESQLLTLEREYKLKETTYLHMLQKKEENEMKLVTTTTNTRIISLPTGSNSPVAPKSKMVLLVALFIGVAIPGSVVVGKEFLDVTIRGEKDLENLSVPLLGVIALADSKEQRGGALLVRDRGTDMLNETFRMVRTHLDTISGADTKVIMFTSFEPGPGKTFIALNLAMSLALAGKRVALLDLDMRTATLSRMISNPAQGISFYLSGIIPEERFIIEENYFYNGFDVIPVGEIPPNPTELLMTERFRGLIARLKRNYDYVFLDCTPLDVVADANIVGKQADLSVFVVREGYTNRRKLREIEKIHKKGLFKSMATILNAAKLEVTFGKHHHYFNDKASEVAKLPRASYMPGKTRFITEGSKSHQNM